MSFTRWLHTRSAARIAGYQFAYTVGFKRISYGEFLYKKYLRWADRVGVTPSGEPSDYQGF